MSFNKFSRTLVISVACLPFILSSSNALANDIEFEQRLERLERMVNNKKNFMILNQLYSLQDEVSMLRGNLDEANHEISTLKQQQLALYKDLDKRIQQTKNAQVSVGNDKLTSTSEPSNTAATEQLIKPDVKQNEEISFNNDKQAYNAAYDALVAKNYQKSLSLFEQMLKSFPDSALVPNAYYWQGELYLLEEKSDNAINAFKHVLDKFPNHQKYPDALLKLGYAYQRKGETGLASDIFKKVKKNYAGSALARLAEAQLDSIKTN